jgi:hypothetical protein
MHKKPARLKSPRPFHPLLPPTTIPIIGTTATKTLTGAQTNEVRTVTRNHFEDVLSDDGHAFYDAVTPNDVGVNRDGTILTAAKVYAGDVKVVSAENRGSSIFEKTIVSGSADVIGQRRRPSCERKPVSRHHAGARRRWEVTHRARRRNVGVLPLANLAELTRLRRKLAPPPKAKLMEGARRLPLAQCAADHLTTRATPWQEQFFLCK